MHCPDSLPAGENIICKLTNSFLSVVASPATASASASEPEWHQDAGVTGLSGFLGHLLGTDECNPL